jgi:hypothetical protein
VENVLGNLPRIAATVNPFSHVDNQEFVLGERVSLMMILTRMRGDFLSMAKADPRVTGD